MLKYNVKVDRTKQNYMKYQFRDKNFKF